MCKVCEQRLSSQVSHVWTSHTYRLKAWSHLTTELKLELILSGVKIC